MFNGTGIRQWISKEGVGEGSLCGDGQIGIAKKGPLIVGDGKEVKDAVRKIAFFMYFYEFCFSRFKAIFKVIFDNRPQFSMPFFMRNPGDLVPENFELEDYANLSVFVQYRRFLTIFGNDFSP